MTLMAGMDITIRAVREQISSAINLIVQQSRLQDGTRRITHVTEIVGMEVDVITLQDLFVFDIESTLDDQGGVRGKLRATGLRPHFLQKLADRQVKLDVNLFEPPPGWSRGETFGRRRDVRCSSWQAWDPSSARAGSSRSAGDTSKYPDVTLTVSVEEQRSRRAIWS
jgi:hypothetical protein